MNISKINFVPFKGKLIIQDKKDWYNFKTEDIRDIIDFKDKKETRIYGSEDSYRSPYKYLSIPYSVLEPNKIMAAYTAACQSPRADVRLINREGQCNIVE